MICRFSAPRGPPFGDALFLLLSAILRDRWLHHALLLHFSHAHMRMISHSLSTADAYGLAKVSAKPRLFLSLSLLDQNWTRLTMRSIFLSPCLATSRNWTDASTTYNVQRTVSVGGDRRLLPLAAPSRRSASSGAL